MTTATKEAGEDLTSGKLSAQLAEIISVSEDRGIRLQTMLDLSLWAETVHRSGMAPAGLNSRAKIMVAAQTGMELGFSPMASLRVVYVIKGLPALMAVAVSALILRSGKAEVWEPGVEGEGEDMVGFVRLKRKGGPLHRVTFSWKDAKRAGLTDGDNYRKYPARMLLAKAIGHAGKDYFADVTLGIAVAEDVMGDASYTRPSQGIEDRKPPQGPDPLLGSTGGDGAAEEPDDSAQSSGSAAPPANMEEEEDAKERLGSCEVDGCDEDAGPSGMCSAHTDQRQAADLFGGDR